MGNDRIQCLDLRPSCAAIATRESLRNQSDAMPATIDGHGPEKHHVLCPFSAQVRPGQERGGRGEFD